MTYCSGEDVFNQLAPPNNQATSVVLLGSLLGIGLAGAAIVGSSALSLLGKNFKALRIQVDTEK